MTNQALPHYYKKMPCNINGFKNRPFIIVNNPNDIISDKMKYLSIEDYHYYLNPITGILNPEYGSKLSDTGCAFDKIEDHSYNRFYFIDSSSLESKKITPVCKKFHFNETKLNSLVKEVKYGVKDLADLKFLFNNFVYVSNKGIIDFGLRYDFKTGSILVYRADLKTGRLGNLLETIKDKSLTSEKNHYLFLKTCFLHWCFKEGDL